MKGKAKVLSLLLALAMTASVFAACGDNGGSPSSNNGGAVSNTGDDKPNNSGEVVELTWWHWGEASKNPDAAIAALNEKSAKDIGVKIKFLYSGTDDTKQKTAMSTGASDDIVFTCSWWAHYPTVAQQGQLYDITDMLPTETPDLWKFLPEYMWKGAEVNGRIYAVPTYKDSAASQFWSCNKDFVIDAAGAEAEFKATGMKVATVTPLLQKVKAYADANGGTYPHDMTAPFNYNKAGLNGHGVWFNPILDTHRIGVRNDDSNYKVVSYFEDADYVADLKTLAEWYKEGLVNQDCGQLDKEPEWLVVGTGQGWEGVENSNWGVNKDYKVAINRRCGPYANTSTIIGSMQGILANSKHVKESLKYIEYMNTNAEYRNMLAYGAEGVNWKDNGDGTISKLNDDYGPGAFSQATFFLLKPVSPAPADMYTAMQTEMDKAELSELLGFLLNQDDIQTEVAATSTVFEKYTNGLQCGTYADVDATIAEMMKELEATGYRKIIETAQAQVDAFLGK